MLYSIFPFSSDSTPDSSIDLYDAPKRASNLLTNNCSNNKSNTQWTHHIANRKRIASNSNVDSIVYGKDRLYQNINNDDRTSESDCDNDKKYPDLLDISGMAMQMNLAPTTTSTTQLYTQSKNTINNNNNNNNRKKSTASNNPFCTLPRKKHNFNSHKTISSESQSPLLTDTSSHYGSSTFADSDLLGRRLSNESFNNYPLSISSMRNNNNNNQSNNGRSNSFLNLTTTQPLNSGKPLNMNFYYQQKRNPSLPSSPSKETAKVFDVGETPLLDFSTLAIHKQKMLVTPSTSTSNTTATNAYDYHAAQLERFLEEYRNLQEQLCKMKETCESIRKKEAPLRATAGNSVKVADPIMFTALNSNASGSLSFSDGSPNPKGILKNKILLPNQPPDPPPYWLHRNAMLKKLQDPDADFFNS